MDFNTSFQLKLLAIFYCDKEWYLRTKEDVKPEYFNSEFLKWLFLLVERYFIKYKVLPTTTVVKEEIRKDENLVILDEEKPLVDEFINLIISGDIPDSGYIKDTFNQFVRSKAIDEVLFEHADEARKEGNFDRLTSSLRSRSKDFDRHSTQLVDPDNNLFSMHNLTEIYENRNGMKTGIKLIDNVIGGMLPKELSLTLADTNVGKSLLAAFMGGNVVKQMEGVTHVTLEMSLPRTLVRYFSTLAEDEDGVTYGDIYSGTPFEKVDEFITRLKGKYEGYLNIAEYPPGTCTLETLERLLDKYHKTKLLIVDYLDLMKPPRKRDALRFELSDLTTGLRAIASERNIHVHTPTQATRTSANKRVVSKEHASEDYGKMRIPDWAIAMGQNDIDVNKHEVVFNLVRSRNTDKNYKERYFIDFSRMRFKYIGIEQTGSGLLDGNH